MRGNAEGWPGGWQLHTQLGGDGMIKYAKRCPIAGAQWPSLFVFSLAEESIVVICVNTPITRFELAFVLELCDNPTGLKTDCFMGIRKALRDILLKSYGITCNWGGIASCHVSSSQIGTEGSFITANISGSSPAIS
jgi:hypothetical protein